MATLRGRGGVCRTSLQAGVATAAMPGAREQAPTTTVRAGVPQRKNQRAVREARLTISREGRRQGERNPQPDAGPIGLAVSFIG